VTTEVLSKRILYAHGTLGMPLAVIGYPLSIWIPAHYSGGLGISLATVGTILMLAIVSGESLQSGIINFASSKGSFSVKQVQNVLNFYAKDTSQQLWVKKREKENNALRFSLVEDEVSSFLD
jgi:hypothetical protein